MRLSFRAKRRPTKPSFSASYRLENADSHLLLLAAVLDESFSRSPFFSYLCIAVTRFVMIVKAPMDQKCVHGYVPEAQPENDLHSARNGGKDLDENSKQLYEDNRLVHDNGKNNQTLGESVAPSCSDGQRIEALAGLIFMCSAEVRKSCFRHGVFGMPASKKHLLNLMSPGTKLFLFEFESRQLWGVYEATTNMCYDIEPDIYQSSAVPFPFQVRFRISEKCRPLPEKIFKSAIKDNYYSSFKFNFELQQDQVLKLVNLFVHNEENVSTNVMRYGMFSSEVPDIKLHDKRKLENVESSIPVREKILEGSMARSSAHHTFSKKCKSISPDCVPLTHDNHLVTGEEFLLDTTQRGFASCSGACSIQGPSTSGQVFGGKHHLLGVGPTSPAQIPLEDCIESEIPVKPHYVRESTGGILRKRLADFFEGTPVKFEDYDDLLLKTNQTDGSLEEQLYAYKLKMKELNDKALSRQQSLLNRQESANYLAYQSDPKWNCLDSVSSLHFDKIYKSMLVERGARKGILIDEEEYLELKSCKDALYQGRHVVSQDMKQTLSDNLSPYIDTIEDVQWVTDKDLELYTTQKVVPDSVFACSSPARAGPNVDYVQSAQTPKSNEYITSSLLRNIPAARSVPPLHGKDWSTTSHEGANNLASRLGKVQDFCEKSEQPSSDKIENQVQRSLMRILGKRSRSFLEYSDNTAKGKRSVWSRLSGLKHTGMEDPFWFKKENKSESSKGYTRSPSTYSNLTSGKHEERALTSTDFRNSSISYENGVTINFKRRTCSKTDDLCESYRGAKSCELDKDMESKDNESKLVNGRRKIKRPVLNNDVQIAPEE